MNTHSPCIRALDVGYGNTKYSIDNAGTCEMFASIAHRNTTLSLGSESLARRQTTHVFVDNQIFEVGPDACIFEERPQLHSDFISTPQFRALALGAMSRMNTQHIDLLVTGLPIHLLQSQNTRLAQLLTGYHQINESLSVTVQEVKVIAQPLGGFISHAYSSSSFTPSKAKANLLIDPGYFTFDWLVARGLMEIPELSGSVEAGAAECSKRVEASICRELNIQYSNLLATDAGLRTGQFELYGKPFDLIPHKQASDEVVERALSEMRSVVGTGEQISGIFLAGGAAHYFEGAVRCMYPNHCITIINEPILANVRGFHLLAQHITRRRVA